jgi:sulfatase maturation enzyme AslB (radical SAM superfamily)
VDVILKPTALCNFKCTFCSSTYLSEDNKEVVDLSQLERFIARFPETRTIIVNGGDPLMMPPEYYWDMIAMLDRLGSNASISFTSNLWPFYVKPEKWQDLFRHERLGVTTSFQYGDKRLKGDGTPLTEEEFVAVSDLFLERVGYRPDFIAVIDKDNAHTVLDTVRLAQRLGVEAKVNYAVASGPVVVKKGIAMGNAETMYTQADMYKAYIEIYDAGLMQWEFNTKQMVKRIKTQNTICPLSRDCDSGIRSLQPNNGYFSCGAFGDDLKYPIDFEKEMAGEFFTPLRDQEELWSMKESCNACPMFLICNGCRKTVADTKRLGLAEHHCKTMKSIAPRLIELNGMQDYLTPTPYVDESVQIIARG